MKVPSLRAMRIAWVFPALVLTSPALGHRPTFSDGTAKDANHAIEIKDVDVSQVVYHEVTADSPRVWLTFEAKKGQPLFVQIGIPVIERLTDYRPSVLLLGPGLDPVSVPFEIPTSLGGTIISTDDVQSPREFHEEFTDTRSWILKEQTMALPASGRYYLVAHAPGDAPGKLWLAVGKKEDFGLADLLMMREWIVKARRFHEENIGLALPCGLGAILLAVGLGRACFRTFATRGPVR